MSMRKSVASLLANICIAPCLCCLAICVACENNCTCITEESLVPLWPSFSEGSARRPPAGGDRPAVRLACLLPVLGLPPWLVRLAPNSNCAKRTFCACLPAWPAWPARLACPLGLPAWPACLACLSGLPAWPACLACLLGLPARLAQQMPHFKLCRARLVCLPSPSCPP